MNEKGTISIVNWEKFQHYKERNPPWIKLHNSLLDNYEYSCLQDASKLLLISLYLLASRTQNQIPSDIQWIKKRAMIDGKINLTPLITAGFITQNGICNQIDSDLLASCKQNADSETEKRQRREETEKTFEQFWSAYPKKKNKGQAEKVWKTLKPNQSLVLKMLATIEKAKKSHDWTKDAGKWIPYPSTWLNAKGWEDEILTEDEENMSPSMRRLLEKEKHENELPYDI